MRKLFSEVMRPIIRPIALTILFPTLGFLICLLVEMLFKIEIPRVTSSVINFVLAAIAALFLFPRVFGIPFGKIGTQDFNKRVGFYLPGGAWKHILLGVILALCTLSGMLVASILTGKYELNFGTITLTQSVFSFNPGIWEEVFYRGIQMMILIRLTKSLRKAGLIHVVLFGLLHIKGADIPALVDAVSVMIIAVGFTYTAYKTRALIAGIVFHYLHDALLFFVQVPNGVQTGIGDIVLFYVMLWSMVGAGCLITKFAAEKLRVCASTDLYTLKSSSDRP